MGETSKIEWTDATFNPWWGCQEVSPACDNCYARRDAERYGFVEGGAHFPIWGQDMARRFFGDKHWNAPLTWNRKAADEGRRVRVFSASYADVMEDRRDLDDPRKRLYDLIEATPNLDWLLLTKRPQNFRRFFPKLWLSEPRPNVWGMTTVESQDYLWRAIELGKTPFAIRGLSMEPLLGPVNLALRRVPLLGQLEITCPKCEGSGSVAVPGGGKACPMCYMDDFGGVGNVPAPDWIITGGESGPGARPAHPDWYRSLRDQAAAAGAPFLFKQWGEWSPDGTRTDVPMILLTRNGRDGSDLANVDDDGDVWLRRLGKKVAGRLLDGRTHDGFPILGGQHV